MSICGVDVFPKQSITLGKESRVIYYVGSFNPPHRGHQEAVKKALEVMNAACIIIAAAENPYKSEKMDLSHRHHMRNKTFANDNRVYIAKDNHHLVRAQLLAQKLCIIHLFGTDGLTYFQQKTETPFSEFCISRRDDYQGDEIRELLGKKVTFINPDITNCSSTKIRNHLRLHPEAFFNHSSIDDPILSFLDKNTLKYIVDNRLFVPELNVISKSTMKEISSHLPEVCQIICLNILEKGGNASGDLIFQVTLPNTETYCFIKSFVNRNKSWRMSAESKAFKTLSPISFQHLKFPKLLWSIAEQESGHIALSPIPGRDIGAIWKSAYKDKTNKKLVKAQLSKMSFLVGKALFELHQYRIMDAAKETFEIWLKTKTHKLQDYLKELEPHLLHEKHSRLVKLYQSLLLDFKQNPPKQTYIHADPNLSNYLVNLEEQYVTLIDFSDCGKAIAEDGSPLGYSSEDLARYLSYLDFYELQMPLGEDIVKSMKETFLEGYGKQAMEQNKLVHFFWNVRSLLNCFRFNTEHSLQKVDDCLNTIFRI